MRCRWPRPGRFYSSHSKGAEMVNPFAGEVEIRLNDEILPAKLTLGALAELEAELGDESLLAMIARFEGGAFQSRDVLAVIVAGLRGAGWTGRASDLLQADLQGGPVAAGLAAAQLLSRAFQGPPT